MKDKKQVLRSCVISREVLEKKDLIRVVRTPEKQVIVDTKGKTNGRGAYLKLDKAIILKASKSKVLNKKLEVEIPQEIYEELLSLVNEQ